MDNKNNKQKRPGLLSFLWPYLLILGILIVAISLYGSGNGSSTEIVSFEQLQEVFEDPNKEVTKIQVSEKETVIDIAGTYQTTENGKTVKETFTVTFPIVPESDEFNGDIVDIYALVYSVKDSNGNPIVEIKNAFQSSIWSTIFMYIIPAVAILFVMFLLIGKMGGKNSDMNKSLDFGKSKAKNISNCKIRFKDVAGCEEEKAEMIELVDYLKNPKRYAEMGARIPKGVILKGSPGTGKTLLAKAVAGEAHVPFLSISGSDFVEMFVGVGASRVRDMFAQAKKHAPCIVFIDEIDAVGRQRGTGLGGGHDEREQTLNQLLSEMDGFGDNTGIIVIAATNRPDVLDPALLRPGRFDRQITVNLPDKKGRIEILKVHARNKKFAGDVDFAAIAARTPGFSGAELENVLNESAILAVRLNHDKITTSDIDEAIDRVMGGPAKKTKNITEHEKKLVAYHEAGHTMVGLKLDSAMKVQKVTIIPRGDAGGYVLMTPSDDRTLMTKSELLEEISGLLGGRASEEIFFGDVTSGAQSDISKATKIARMMVTELGMSPLGPIQYEQQRGSVFLGRDYTDTSRNISGEVAFEIDQEIKKIINDSMEISKKIINENKEKVTLIAETLLEKETLTYEEVMQLMNNGKLNETTDEVKEEPKVEEIKEANNEQ